VIAGSAGNKRLEKSIQSGYWLIRKNHNSQGHLLRLKIFGAPQNRTRLFEV
jgi:hypothetical protein